MEFATEATCIFCARWHPGLRYAPLIEDWVGEKCLLGVVEENPNDEVARMIADELNLNFATTTPTDSVCGLCGVGESIGILDDEAICWHCWNQIRP
jgi:hypothetical protein